MVSVFVPCTYRIDPKQLVRFKVAKQSCSSAKVKPLDLGIFLYYIICGKSIYHAVLRVADLYGHFYEVRCFEIELLNLRKSK